MTEPGLINQLLECGCRQDTLTQEVCDLCQVIKPEIFRLRARVAELEAALERIIAGPYAGDFSSTIEVASEALKHKPLLPICGDQLHTDAPHICPGDTR